LQRELAGHRYLEQLSSIELPYLRSTFCLGDPSWDALLRGAARVSDSQLDACASSVSPFDDALIVYTSGTTARPKGALHAHRSPTLQSRRFAEQLCLDDEVRTWSAFPFFWTAGFCM